MKLCIGLCDDNPLHLRMISQEIQRLCGMREIEAEIHTWTSGAQLLKEIETYDIQLYILDIRMPEITGIDAAKQINLIQPSAQIIFISSYLEYFSDVYETEFRSEIADGTAASGCPGSGAGEAGPSSDRSQLHASQPQPGHSDSDSFDPLH